MNPEKHKDENIKLWNAVRKGDRLAFDNLYRNHVQLLFNYGVKLVARPEIVKDAIQDLFADLWRKREQLQIEKSIKNYLLLSLRRLIFRKIKNLKTVQLEEDSIAHPFQLPKEFSEIDSSAAAKNQKIKQAITLLPKRQREAIFLKYYENQSYEEIAKVMEIQVAAVYKLVSVGIKKLRTIL